jgi:NAD(P)-dependent dehydrogenase (short-subunit alcohol dehydrogenase family)
VVNDTGGSKEGSGYSHDPARSVVEKIKASGGEAVANYDDISSVAGANNVARNAFDNFGTIDILINNAGITRNKSLIKMDLEDFKKVLDVHLLGTVYLTKAVLPEMRAKSYGRIVMTTSIAGLYGNFGQTNYGAAKMAIVGLMNSLKLEEEKHNICINTIAPMAASRLGEGILPDDLMAKLKPELVTAAVAYLCSEQCQASGDIISAGAGFYSAARMVEGKGVRFDLKEPVTPEMVAARYDEITDMSGAVSYQNASEEMMAMSGHSFSM